jgi:hypothetical protein
MIKFFRKIRQNMLTENKFSKYLIYAIGEIILVVIGILIALQINNANEVAKQQRLQKIYEKNLIIELDSNLNTLDELDTQFQQKLELIKNYISYQENPNLDVNVVIQKMDSIQYNSDRDMFNGKAYVIDDIISTGNLSLFSKEKKDAILKLKNRKEFVEKIKNEVDEERFLTNQDFEKSIDLISFNRRKGKIFEAQRNNQTQVSTDEEDKKNSWIFNLNSEQYRLFNNKILKERNTYSFRIWANSELRKATENLLTVLENDGKNK